jgi:hypothetical protein
MSIGITVVLPSAVLTVTDSRKSFPLEPWRKPDDSQSKLFELRSWLTVIESGSDLVTRHAIARLDKTLPKTAPPAGEVLVRLGQALREAWPLVSFAPGVDLRTERAALLAGGIADGDPFLATALGFHDGRGDTALRRELFDFLMLGGEEVHAAERFEERIHAVGHRHGETFTDELFEAALDAAGTTIRDVAASDRTVGGPIRFHLARTDGSSLRGVWARVGSA